MPVFFGLLRLIHVTCDNNSFVFTAVTFYCTNSKRDVSVLRLINIQDIPCLGFEEHYRNGHSCTSILAQELSHARLPVFSALPDPTKLSSQVVHPTEKSSTLLCFRITFEKYISHDW